jgi:hypothetical protein
VTSGAVGSKRDSTPQKVGLFHGQIQFSQAADRLRSKSFVQLHHINILHRFFTKAV